MLKLIYRNATFIAICGLVSASKVFFLLQAGFGYWNFHAWYSGHENVGPKKYSFMQMRDSDFDQTVIQIMTGKYVWFSGHDHDLNIKTSKSLLDRSLLFKWLKPCVS